MTVREILEQWLKDHGYGGLMGEGCCCGIEDLAPCGEYFLDCEPGIKKPGCSPECWEQCDYHIVPKEAPQPVVTYHITPGGQKLYDIVCTGCAARNDRCRGSIAEFESCSEIEQKRKELGLSFELYERRRVEQTK